MSENEKAGSMKRVSDISFLCTVAICNPCESVRDVCLFEANKIEQQTEGAHTHFEWNVVSVRCRKYVRLAVESCPIGLLSPYKWPLSCEDLMKIGREKLSHVRNIGESSLNEIESILSLSGFSNWNET